MEVSQNSKVYGLEKAEFVEAAFEAVLWPLQDDDFVADAAKCRNCELFHSRKDHFYDDKFAELEKKEAVSSIETWPFFAKRRRRKTK